MQQGRLAQILLALLCTCALAAAESIEIAAPAPPGAFVPATPLVQIARALAAGDAGERVEFARIALTALADEYARAASAAGSSATRQRWSRETTHFADQLTAQAERLTDATTVDILVEASDAVRLMIDRTPVMLSGPSLDDPYRLDRHIVALWCESHPCAAASDDAAASGASPRADARPPDGAWAFSATQGPTFTTDRGLEFVFGDATDLARKKALALDLSGELVATAAGLREALARGAALEWEHLALQSDAGDLRQSLRLSARGDVLVLPLPLLARAPEMMTAAVPWLRAQVEGRWRQLRLQGLERLLPAASTGASGHARNARDPDAAPFD